MVFHIKNRNMLLMVLYATFLVAYIDQFASGTVGIVISYLIFMTVATISVFSIKGAVSALLIFSFTIPENSRTLVGNIDAISQNFFTFRSITFSGIGLSQWSIIVIVIAILARVLLGRTKFDVSRAQKKVLAILLFLTVVLLTVTAVDTALTREYFSYRYFVSDIRSPLILLFGIIVGIYIKNEGESFLQSLITIIFFVALVNGLKTILFLSLDYINSDFKLSYSTEPYLQIPLIFAYLYSGKDRVHRKLLISMLIFFGGFNIARGDMIYFMIEIILLGYLLIRDRSSTNPHRIKSAIIFLFSITLLPIFILQNFNPRAYKFLIYKMDFFSKELSTNQYSFSPKVRIYEFLNITNEAIDTVYPLLVGRGYGSYFTFENVPFPSRLGLSDYSAHQLNENKYYKPHTFINYFLLKGGIVYLSLYILLLLSMFTRATRMVTHADGKEQLAISFAVFFTIFALNMYWLPRYSFLYGLLYSLLPATITESDRS